VGVIAGKRLGGAVIRNKVKRQLRAIMQKVYPSLPKHCDILLIARQPIVTASFQQIDTAVQASLQRAGLLENTHE
jgi:ribonuclease P protein component